MSGDERRRGGTVPDDEGWLRRIGATAEPGDALADRHADTDDRTEVIDLDDPHRHPGHETEEDHGTAAPHHPTRRFTPWVAAVFCAVAVVATAITAVAGALTANHPGPKPNKIPTARPAPPPPPTTPATADTPIPFTASADCPPGSTAAQSVADPQAKTPWICARTVDGQVVHIDLGRAYVITAVSIVPGATAGGDGSADPWLQHRVVTRIQWQFNDTDKTVRTQNTGNVRGEAVLSVPSVLASAITVIIQQTSRPPAVAPTSSAPPTDGALGPLLDTTPVTPLPTDASPSDPSDGTFAVTTIKVIGHQAS